MVIIRITGGLGNQMFQYAAGKATALRTQSKLVLNTAFFEDGRIKQKHETKLHLEIFPNIAAKQLEQISAEELLRLEKNSQKVLRLNADRILRRIGLMPSYQVVQEYETLTYRADFHLQRAAILNLSSDWQNENYFVNYADNIRADFAFPELAQGSANSDILTEIQRTDSVSLHVRRGDYLFSDIHQPTSLEYYSQAINTIEQSVKNPNFFVFSDDIEWCKANLPLRKSTYISHNMGEQSYIDMQLMSNCKHNLIANSSFSWWGAWLNTNHRKIVIAPKTWLSKLSISSEKVVPNDWILL